MELKDKCAVGGVISGALPSESAHRKAVGESLFYVEREFGKRTSGFVAYVGDFPRHGSPGHVIELETAVRVRPRQRIDVFVGFGTSHAAPDAFVAVGYSFRLDAVLGKANR